MSFSLPSVMKHDFSHVPQARIQRSSFDRSSGLKTTLDADYIVPIYVEDILPGDTVNMRVFSFGRLATPLHPFMDNVFMDFFWFFVPLRLLWTNFPKFMGEQVNPGDSTDFLTPVIVAPGVDGWITQDLQDYFGWPTYVAGITTNNFAGRAYNLIWNTWFRDQNAFDSAVVDMDDGPDTATDYVLRKRGKRYDYFTSCLPWPQKGAAVSLPLGTSAPVIRDTSTTNSVKLLVAATGANPINSGLATISSDGTFATTPGNVPLNINPNDTLITDLSDAVAATVNELYQAFAVQDLLTADARGGTRYTEIIQGHFGVVSPDARLQRPEYCGGGSTMINVNPVAQTAPTTETTTPQGNLAAFATVRTDGQIGFTKSFTEHGILMGLVNIRADLNYQQGIERQFSRRTRYDFYWPELANIGEQAVLNQEIFAINPASVPGQNEDVFGYNERYAEYRYKPSQVTGKMRSNDPQSLDTWHLAQEFGSLPVLIDEFLESDSPLDRVLAITEGEPECILDVYFKSRWVRPMPMYGVPGFVRRF